MAIKTIEYQGLVVDVYHNETEDLWTAYMHHALYDVGQNDDESIERLVFDHEPTQDEIDQLLCLELAI